MNIAFVICTRTDSSRLPNKVFRKINGVPLIEHLLKRLQKTGLPIHLAYPDTQHDAYKHLNELDNVFLYPSKDHSDPLARMRNCANFNMLDAVIRASHDKIFVDEADIKEAIKVFKDYKLDYLFGNKFIAGTGFEIISAKALNDAADKYKNVEYIGYAVRSVTENICNWNPKQPVGNYRFLIDYDTDLKFLDVVFSQLGNDCSLNQAIQYLNQNSEIKQINSKPMLTIYTCALNAEHFLETCMDSVARQTAFRNAEYILIDDFSTDKTCELMAKFSLKYKNVRFFRNEKNLGLASSSNIALKKAKGRYIMRLDADDYFVSPHAANEMLKKIQAEDLEAVYPDNYFGDMNKTQKGRDNHHAGGALFNKDALTHIKFTDGLMGHDSLDVYLRAKDKLKIGYIEKPMFFYRQHDSSLTKTNLAEREEIKKRLLLPILNPFNDEFKDHFDTPEEAVRFCES